jgi:CHAD domain-containing protein
MSEIYRWRNKINIYKLSVTEEIQPVHKNMGALRDELLSIRRFHKVKEIAKQIRDENSLELKGNVIFIN